MTSFSFLTPLLPLHNPNHTLTSIGCDLGDGGKGARTFLQTSTLLTQALHSGLGRCLKPPPVSSEAFSWFPEGLFPLTLPDLSSLSTSHLLLPRHREPHCFSICSPSWLLDSQQPIFQYLSAKSLSTASSLRQELGKTEPAETLIAHTYQWLICETWETCGYCFVLRNSSPKRASLYHSSIGAASQAQSLNLHIPQLSSDPDGNVSQALGDILKVVHCSAFPKGRSEKWASISPPLWDQGGERYNPQHPHLPTSLVAQW